MTLYNDIRYALAASVKSSLPFPMNVFPYMPRTFVPPTALVFPNTRTINYLQMMSSPSAEWHYTVMIVIGQPDEEAAQNICGELISPGSSMITAINNTVIPSGFAVVTDGSVSERTVPGASNDGAALYTHAELHVMVKA